MCGGRWEDGDLQATSTKVKPGEPQGSRLQGQGGVMQPGACTELPQMPYVRQVLAMVQYSTYGSSETTPTTHCNEYLHIKLFG